MTEAVIPRPARKTKAGPPAVGPLEGVAIQGDLTPLSEEQRLEYYRAVCDSLALNPLTSPFGYVVFQGKLKLYALKNCTDQLRALRGVSITITRSEPVGDFYFVQARATLPDGRTDEDCGVVSLAGLKGPDLANAYMRCTTKAKRRVTLSVCGLGWLDETEVETVEGARPALTTSHQPLTTASEASRGITQAQVIELKTRCANVAALTDGTWQDVAEAFGLPMNGGGKPGGWLRLNPEAFVTARDALKKRQDDLEAALAGEDPVGPGA